VGRQGPSPAVRESWFPDAKGYRKEDAL